MALNDQSSPDRVCGTHSERRLWRATVHPRMTYQRSMIGGVRVYALRLTYAVSSAGMHCSLSSATNQVSHVLPVALGVMGGFEGTRWKQRSYRHRSATSPHRSVFELGNRVSGAAVAAGVMLLNRCTAYSSYLGYGHNGHRDAVDAYVAKVDVPFFFSRVIRNPKIPH